MRPNLELLKTIIRLLILVMLLVMLFIISIFLYSAKYWPDVYNYINANITIKRIPTISELHPVIVYESDFTTEIYSTTDISDYLDESTDDDDFILNFDDLMNDDTEEKRRKRQIPVEEMKVNIEIVKANYDYVFDFDVTTKSFVEDIVNVQKPTTTDANYIEIITSDDESVESETQDKKKSARLVKIKPTDGVDSVYPWIATVFVMSPDSKQFEYICDGILLSKEAVLTSARCVMKNNVTVDSINILIIMGKRSLQSTGPNEKITRVKSIKLHDNFVSSEGKVDNDLAIAVLAEPVSFNSDIQPAPLGIEDKSAPIATATTGWHFSGPLQPLYLGPQSMENSRTDDICSHLYCATLDNNETTCPSFGGLFVERHEDNQWRLKGIASGSPTSTGVCFNKKLTFTKIENYIEWIKTNIQETSSK